MVKDRQIRAFKPLSEVKTSMEQSTPPQGSLVKPDRIGLIFG
jgi:hypothetical protein